jgi:hypothetical protein
MAPPLKIALIQMRVEEDPAANLARALEKIDAAAQQGARVACLPELFRSRYFCQSEDTQKFDLAEPIPGESTEALAKLAAKREIAIVASLFERRAEGVYHNTAIVLDTDGRSLGAYRKMHIPDDPLYYEKFYFVLGPVVPGSGAPHRARRSADPVLPHRDRLAVRRGRVHRHRAARRLGDGAARPRDRERRVRRGHQSRRARGPHPLLGPIVRG